MALSTTTVTGHPGHAAPPTPRRGRLAVRLAAVTLVALVGTAACAVPEPEAPEPITVTPSTSPNRVLPPEPQTPVVWPLTGMPTEEVAQRPAVAVKIENTSAARPQSGLENADVVWETIVEFEVSRLIAVYHSQVPAEVGPIRSVRPMDMVVAAPLKGPFVYSGGQGPLLTLAYASSLQSMTHDGGAAGMYRVRFRSAPHNVYGSIQTFMDNADSEHSAPPAEQFAFAPRPSLAAAVRLGTPATVLDFRLSGQARPSWTWDAASGTWHRSEGSSAATDAAGNRLAAVNVVTVTAGHPPSGYGAQGGASIPTYELVGEGDAVIATGGMTVGARWRKADQDSPLQLFLPDGTPALLAPGNTWVELVPAGKGSLTIG